MPSGPDFLALFRNETNIASLKPGETLFSEGDPALCMYVVRSGTVRVTSGSAVLEEIGAGSILGEMALIEDRSMSCGCFPTACAR